MGAGVGTTDTVSFNNRSGGRAVWTVEVMWAKWNGSWSNWTIYDSVVVSEVVEAGEYKSVPLSIDKVDGGQLWFRSENRVPLAG